MNQTIATRVREAGKSHKMMLPAQEEPKRLPRQVVQLVEEARQGGLSGQIELVGDELHFRPDGYNYWVPVDENPARVLPGQVVPGAHIRVRGHIVTRGGQPDRIVVEWARPIE